MPAGLQICILGRPWGAPGTRRVLILDLVAVLGVAWGTQGSPKSSKNSPACCLFVHLLTNFGAFWGQFVDDFVDAISTQVCEQFLMFFEANGGQHFRVRNPPRRVSGGKRSIFNNTGFPYIKHHFSTSEGAPGHQNCLQNCFRNLSRFLVASGTEKSHRMAPKRDPEDSHIDAKQRFF